MGKTLDESPSAARRKALRDADAVSPISMIQSSRPISFYLNLTKRLLDHFHTAVDERRLDDGYILGVRFASFCLEGLPKHPDYNHHRKHAQQVEKVLAQLEDITARMDAEEIAKQRHEEMIQQQEQEARQETIEKSAMAKLMALQRTTSQRDTTAMATGSSTVSKVTTAATDSHTTTKHSHPKVKQVQKSLPSVLDSLPSLQTPTPSTPPEASTSFTNTLRPDEQRTIQLLERTIVRQTDRLSSLETTMGLLRLQAKELLRQNQRRAALGKMAQRKRIDQNLQSTKNAIWNMETQIMRIEAAASDRDANLAMQKASLLMKELTIVDPSTVAEELSELQMVNDAVSQTILDDFDEDALLSELLDDNDDKEEVEDLPDLLQLPSVPNAPTPEPDTKPLMATIA